MELTVQLDARSYPVFLNDGGSFPEKLVKVFPGRRFALVTNTTVAKLYKNELDILDSSVGLVRHTIEDGEQFKNVDTWVSVLDTLLTSGLDRQSIVIAFGGGVVGDIAGFAASAFLRGVDCVQVPTTLLAMVDSSVGGKTGVDHASGKNRIGAFHQPRMVWIDTRYLDTLPQREFVAGYAEVFKYGFIGGSDMFSFITQSHEKILARDPNLLLEAIERSIKIKAAVVSQDERESSGKRALLNFGHTFAHALETYYNYEKLLHGEAVLWGMACACDLGRRAGVIPSSQHDTYDKICALLPDIPLPSKPAARDVYKNMFTDKKVTDGKIRFVLPALPGESILSSGIRENDVIETLESVIEKT